MARGTLRAGQVERELVRQSHSGLDLAGVREVALGSLRRLMSVDAAFFATADPDTLLFTGAYAEEPLAAAQALFLDNEFSGGDVNQFAALASATSHVADLDEATRGERRSSPRYRDIMAPIGLGDELRAALVTGGLCWGYLCLHRTDGPLGFTPAEAALLARLAPHMAHALRHAALIRDAPAAPETGGPGVVLLEADSTVAALTGPAEQLLSLVRDGRADPSRLPAAVYAVAAALDSTERGARTAELPPSARVPTSDGGWLKLHASRLHGDGAGDRTAVIVERASAAETVPLALAAYGLTPREAEVARLVLRGTSTRTIANALRISAHTVQDHLKMVFDKTGARSRGDLVGQLLGQHN
ncbi:MAG TPA: helix-turn-helix transcriptional regulator [Pseudonocardia sp.]|jgi:DNA-binding CsgD family transcriptional regulator|uniref:helix-turn-helix transcriptional regulator n=1 Tax=Pseudonocardia sp. TaxID=60912 RepID=UPI002ED87FCD